MPLATVTTLKSAGPLLFAPEAVVKLPAGLAKLVPTGEPALQPVLAPFTFAVLGSYEMPASKPNSCGDRYTTLFVV